MILHEHSIVQTDHLKEIGLNLDQLFQHITVLFFNKMYRYVHFFFAFLSKTDFSNVNHFQQQGISMMWGLQSTSYVT